MIAPRIVLLALVASLAAAGSDAQEQGTASTPAGQSTPTAQPQETSKPPPPAADRELVLDLSEGVTLKLVRIPAGKFLMGSPEAEKKAAVKEAVAAGFPEKYATDAAKDEVQHEVTISRPFYMGITHVTVDQFAAFVKDSGYKTEAEKDGWSLGFEIKDGQFDLKRVVGCSWRKPSFDQKGDHPVIQVSWNDAQAFCAWLSKRTGRKVRLPTEAQWEYACRAGTKTAYPWGDNPDDGKGWVNGADQSLKKEIPNQKPYVFFSWDDGFAFTSPVGTLKANGFGLYDMMGNVYQWCQDRYGDYETGAVTDPTGADTGGARVLRGGSWGDLPQNCRSADRIWLAPVDRFFINGFRVVLDLN